MNQKWALLGAHVSADSTEKQNATYLESDYKP